MNMMLKMVCYFSMTVMHHVYKICVYSYSVLNCSVLYSVCCTIACTVLYCTVICVHCILYCTILYCNTVHWACLIFFLAAILWAVPILQATFTIFIAVLILPVTFLLLNVLGTCALPCLFL
jgi:hypothetical protein